MICKETPSKEYCRENAPIGKAYCFFYARSFFLFFGKFSFFEKLQHTCVLNAHNNENTRTYSRNNHQHREHHYNEELVFRKA